MDAVAQDHPFGAHADVRGEQALEQAYRQSLVAREVRDTADRAVRTDAVDEGHREVGLGIRAGDAGRQEVCVEGGHPGLLVGRVQDRGRVDAGEMDPAAGPVGDRVLGGERAEAAGAELDAAHPSPALQFLAEEALLDAGDLDEGLLPLEPLEDEVDGGVRDHVGDVRLGQVPVDQPVVLDIGPQRRGRLGAAEAHACEEVRRVDDASGVTAWGGHLRIVGRPTDSAAGNATGIAMGSAADHAAGNTTDIAMGGATDVATAGVQTSPRQGCRRRHGSGTDSGIDSAADTRAGRRNSGDEGGVWPV